MELKKITLNEAQTGSGKYFVSLRFLERNNDKRRKDRNIRNHDAPTHTTSLRYYHLAVSLKSGGSEDES